MLDRRLLALNLRSHVPLRSAQPGEGAMFDIEATIKWVTDVLKDPHGAAIAYKDLAAPWKQTFL